MIRPVLLTRLDYTSGLNVEKDIQIPVRAPSGKLYYVHSFLLSVVLSITGASTSDAIAQRRFAAAVSLFSVEDRSMQPVGSEAPLKGTFLRTLRMLAGRDVITKGDPAAITANQNTTNVVQCDLLLPFWQEALADKRQFCPLGASLTKVKISWAASTLFGTGNTINGSGASYCDVYANLIAADKIESYARLVYGHRGITQFTPDNLALNGRVLFHGFADLSGAATSTIGSTDFVSYDLAGNDGIQAPRQSIDMPTRALNAFGARAVAAYTLPTAGGADVVPLFCPAIGADIGDLPEERTVTVNLVVGAGNPAVTDQEWVFAVIKPIDKAALSEVFGKTPNLNVSVDDAKRAMVSPGVVKGNRGPVPENHPMGGYLRKTLNARVATGRG